MGQIEVNLPDALETRLRAEIVKRFGGRKGDLKKAIEEAVEMWVATGKKPKSGEK